MRGFPLRWPLLASVLALVTTQAAERAPQDARLPQSETVAARVVDAAGQPLPDLRTADVQVVIDGQTVPVLDTRRLSGPAEAGAPVRRVVVAVNRASLPSGGSGRALLEGIATVLERLGPADLAAVWAIPAEGQQFAFTGDRAATRASLLAATGRGGGVSGRYQVSAVEAASIARGTGATLDAVAERECPTQGNREDQMRCRDDLRREAVAQAEQARLEAQATARDVSLLVRALQSVRGVKHLVLLTGGTVPDTEAVTRTIAGEAAASRVTVHAVLAGSSIAGVGGSGGESLEAALATATGGITLTGRDSRAFDRLERELAAEYLLAIAPPDTLRDGRLHDLDVRVARAGQTTVRTARRIGFGAPAVAPAVPAPAAAPATGAAAPAPANVPAPVPPPTAVAPPAPSDAPSPSGAMVAALPLEQLLSRAAAYVQRFEAEMATAVIEERYVQLLKRWSFPPPAPDEARLAWLPVEALTLRDAAVAKRRQTKADLLLVQLADRRWAVYRDVLEADGRALTGREDRLRKLFLEATQDSQRQLRRINQSSADWNLGSFYREINLPTLGLVVVAANEQRRMAFRAGPTERVGEATCRVVTFKETARPTLVHSEERREDVPLSGAVWLDETGTVWRTRIDLDERYTSRGRIEVTYAPHARLKVLMPVRMWEWYLPRAQPPTGVPQYIEALATYSNLRVFTVETSEQVK